ncbi:hypothetical protein NMG60_11001420 [Bertholletia excelsa]
MASNSEADDDWVVLKCVDPDQPKQEDERSEIFICTADIASWDYSVILSHRTVLVKASRNRLIEHSSYFRGLLCGSFSESCLGHVSIEWNLKTFMNILKFMFGCPVDITSPSFLPLFEGALFFGVETLLLKCKTWLSDVTTSKDCFPLQIELNDLIHIWSFVTEHANDSIPELCTSYLARNFMWAIHCKSFTHVPYDLLFNCIKHPDLTADSEMHIADALIVWLRANKENPESLSSGMDGCSCLLKEIRLSFLPLWFSSGKKRCCYFSKFANKSVDDILGLVMCPSTSIINTMGGKGSSQMMVRLTEYTKKVDFSSCPQIKYMILLMSVLPPYSSELMLTKFVKWALSLEYFDGNEHQIMGAVLPTLSFKAVEEVDISNCPGLCLEAAIQCLSKSFPSLKILKAAHFLKFKVAKLYQLVQKCSLLVDIDLAVDISPVIPSQVSIVSSNAAMASQVPMASLRIDGYPLGTSMLYMSKSLQSNLTRLTLEGRLDVSDIDLKNISEFCSSLSCLNLRGCTTVTDAGISVLLLRCVKLHSLLVCYTSFGQNCIQALTSGIPSLDDFANCENGGNHETSLAFKLQVLHMGGCKDVQEMSLSNLLSDAPLLKSLCLRETRIVDNTLYNFHGSSLEMLDVSSTKVSGAALAHIISRNPGLRYAKAQDCRNLFQQSSYVEGGNLASSKLWCKEWFILLGESCKLEEIAFGWGLSGSSLKALRPAIATLRTITVGLGASLGQDALELLPTSCPLLEAVILHFQVISDSIFTNIVRSLRNLQVLALCHCLGEISPTSFKFSMSSLRKLKLERVTPWMTNDDLAILTQNCAYLVELSLLGCRLLNSDSQQIISRGWPGLVSIHLEDCGQVTKNGIAFLFGCKAVEDILLRHNGPGIQRNFIIEAASKMPMLRKVSLDVCDAIEVC